MSQAYQKAASCAGIHYNRSRRALRKYFKTSLRITNGAVEFKSSASADGRRPDGVRGKIITFSRKSAKRLMITALNFEKPIEWWQTFTFADDVMSGKSIEERAVYSSLVLKTFKQWLGAYHPELMGLWRREWEPRKSGLLRGSICPHFHMVFQGGLTPENYERFAVALGALWVKCTGSVSEAALKVATRAPIIESGAVVKQGSFQYLYDAELAICYLSKYMAKNQAATFGGEETWQISCVVDPIDGVHVAAKGLDYPSLGRMWGVIGKPVYSSIEVYQYSAMQEYALCRCFRALMRSKYRKAAEHKSGKALKAWKSRARESGHRINAGETWLLIRRDTTKRIIEFVEGLGLAPF